MLSGESNIKSLPKRYPVYKRLCSMLLKAARFQALRALGVSSGRGDTAVPGIGKGAAECSAVRRLAHSQSFSSLAL